MTESPKDTTAAQDAPAPAVASVSARMECELAPGTVTVASVALARGHARILEESLAVTLDGEPLELLEVHAENGGLLHRIETEQGGTLSLAYAARAEHGFLFREGDPRVDPEEEIRAVRPSRYAPSDVLLPSSFAELPASDYPADDPQKLVDAVGEWVNRQIAYVSGSSRFTDDARDTYLARRGVCRDFAHLVVSFLRSRNIPARVASVYAPGLRPMDFHLVAEALVDGRWRVVDATRLADSDTLLRIATGRDAADTAFLSTIGGSLTLKSLTVSAELEGEGDDDGAAADAGASGADA